MIEGKRGGSHGGGLGAGGGGWGVEEPSRQALEEEGELCVRARGGVWGGSHG
jgi:hypothetical protein